MTSKSGNNSNDSVTTYNQTRNGGWDLYKEGSFLQKFLVFTRKKNHDMYPFPLFCPMSFVLPFFSEGHPSSLNENRARYLQKPSLLWGLCLFYSITKTLCQLQWFVENMVSYNDICSYSNHPINQNSHYSREKIKSKMI